MYSRSLHAISVRNGLRCWLLPDVLIVVPMCPPPLSTLPGCPCRQPARAVAVRGQRNGWVEAVEWKKTAGVSVMACGHRCLDSRMSGGWKRIGEGEEAAYWDWGEWTERAHCAAHWCCRSDRHKVHDTHRSRFRRDHRHWRARRVAGDLHLRGKADPACVLR